MSASKRESSRPAGSRAPSPVSNDTHPAGTRFACCIEYDGSAYNGWQSQPHENVSTVQDSLEAALSGIADEQVRVHCAGRTDAGVHSIGQIVHFDAPAARSCKAWMFGTNTALPRDIRVHWAAKVAPDFHARFSAVARRYRYVIANVAVRPALLRQLVAWHRKPLDAQSMHLAAQHLVGEQDFSAFRASACQANSPMREVQAISVRRYGDFVIIDIKANAFLHHMVRNIAGTLIAVGEGRYPAVWVAQLLEGRDRSAAADTGAAAGLYFAHVTYPDKFVLPVTPDGPVLLATQT